MIDLIDAIRDLVRNAARSGGAETLESLDDELDAMLDLAGGDALTLLMTGAEQTLYEYPAAAPCRETILSSFLVSR